MKAPHQVGPGGWKAPHHRPGGGGTPKPKKTPKPAHHKKPAKPKPPPKPAKNPPHKKPRQLSPGSDVACCSAQAVGTLLGWDWQQVLDLYWRTASYPDTGASIEDTLNAARLRRRDLNPRPLGYEPSELTLLLHTAPLIIGADLPGSHALAVTPDGTWWSWGEPFNPAGWPDLIIEEAWCLR